MNDQTGSTDTLLRDIRDYLAIIAEASLPAHDEAVIARLGVRVAELRSLVNTGAQWDALALIDGTRLVAEVAALVLIDPSNFRKFVNRLTAAGFAIDDGSRGPRFVLSAREVAAIRRTA